MAFLSHTILYHHCRLLNVKARAYDTGFGNPSNTSSTIQIITEDETHFLTRCPKFSGERDDLFNSISAKVKIFTNLSDKNKL